MGPAPPSTRGCQGVHMGCRTALLGLWEAVLGGLARLACGPHLYSPIAHLQVRPASAESTERPQSGEPRRRPQTQTLPSRLRQEARAVIFGDGAAPVRAI